MPPTKEDLLYNKTVQELRELCEQRDLVKSGSKDEIVDRLMDDGIRKDEIDDYSTNWNPSSIFSGPQANAGTRSSLPIPNKSEDKRTGDIKGLFEKIKEQKGSSKGSLDLIRKQLSSMFQEREDLVDCMITALLAREHLFLLGRPGTAKSAIVRALCNSVAEEKDFFQWLIGKFSTPEDLFGPLSIPMLEKGKYERVTDRKLPEAKIVFLDEIFKGNSAILNSLLTIVNERIFFDGTRELKVPLQSLFAASNEIPTTGDLAAIYDRFVFRYEVSYLKEDKSFEKLLMTDQKQAGLLVTAAELEGLQNSAMMVKMPDFVIEVLINLRNRLNAEELKLSISDRKWVQVCKILKAHAFLFGSEFVNIPHLEVLRHVLWTSPRQKETIEEILIDTIEKAINSPQRASVQPIT